MDSDWEEIDFQLSKQVADKSHYASWKLQCLKPCSEAISRPMSGKCHTFLLFIHLFCYFAFPGLPSTIKTPKTVAWVPAKRK